MSTKEVPWEDKVQPEVKRSNPDVYDAQDDDGEPSDDSSVEEIPEGGSVKDRKDRLKYLKKHVDTKNPASFTFPIVPRDFYSMAPSEPARNKLPLSPEHPLIQQWLAVAENASSERKLNADYDRLGEAASFVLENRKTILKFIINQKPENYVSERGKAKSKDSNSYACPGCYFKTNRTGDLVAHFATVLEHQSVWNQQDPPFLFQLGKCSKYPWMKGLYDRENRFQAADCYLCPSGLTALDGLSKGLHATLNPGAFQYIGENKPLMKLFYFKRDFALNFRECFEGINDKGKMSWWTDALANYAVATLYHRIFLLKPRTHDLFSKRQITDKRLLSRRITEVEHLSHSQTKVLGTDFGFLDAWNSRDDLAYFREESLLRDIDDVLNPAPRNKQAKSSGKMGGSNWRKGGV